MSATKDPVRLLADASCPETQRELLRHGVGMQPPRDAEARVWQGLVGALGVAAVGGLAEAATQTSATTSTTTATKAQAAGLTTVKIVTIVVALGALAALVALGTRLAAPAKDPRPPVAVAPAPIVEAPATAPAPPPAPEETWPAERAAPALPRPGQRKPVRAPHRSVTAAAAADTSSTPPSPAARLREETTLIKEARQALRGGDAARALRVLEECRRLFPAGVLEQERERLVIEALVKDGRGSQASARAAAFLRKYPDSPHAGEIRGLGLGAGNN